MATLYDNLQGGVITDNPLTSGATTINSSAFQYLPTVTSPDIMFLTLDPDGANGAPEIVKVTAHTAAATSVTVVRGQQDTTPRSHPVNSAWIHGLTETDVGEFLKTVAVADFEADVLARLPQAGDMKVTVSTVETAAWKNHNQTLVGAESAFPALWAVAPASWKSGSDLTIPNLTDVALIGAGTIAALGALAGSNTKTLAIGELPSHSHGTPAHTHTINHGHGHSIAVSSGDGGHTHTSVSLSANVSGTTSWVGDHQHAGNGNGFVYWATSYGSGSGSQGESGSVWALSWQTHTQAAGGHNHTVSSSGTATGTVASNSSGHTHTVSGGVTSMTGSSGPYSGDATTGSTGSGTAFSLVARSLGVNVQILAI